MKVKRFGALIGALVLACAAVYLPKTATAAGIIGPFVFSTSAASGTIGPFGPQAAAQCSITFNNAAGATFTVQGSADRQIGGTYVTNTNFGSSGVITAPAANSVSSGNTANYPAGFQMLFTGNTGTIGGSVTCSGAIASIGNSLVAGACLTIAGVTISYTCPTAGPQATPNPTATAAYSPGPPTANVTGAWPGLIGITVPQQQGPLLASTANSSLATGTTANTNVQLACGTGAANCSAGTISLTMPTSNLARWYVEFEAYITNGGTTSTGYSYGCFTSTTLGTPLEASRLSVGFPCANSTSNAFAGTGEFGQSGVNAGDAGIAHASFYVANGATVSANCYGANSSTTSITLVGYCKMKAVPSN